MAANLNEPFILGFVELKLTKILTTNKSIGWSYYYEFVNKMF